MPAVSEPPKIVFIFDMSRQRSHLFFRYLGTHPDVETLWHPFAPAYLFGPQRMSESTRESMRKGVTDEIYHDYTYAEATARLLKAVKEAEQKGTMLVIKEHTQMALRQDVSLAVIRDAQTVPDAVNPTVIPDHVWDRLVPIFVIRNPVFAVPSNYIAGCLETNVFRPGDEDWHLMTSMRLQRRLFDHFRSLGRQTPLVVDGDDVIWKTRDLGAALANHLGISHAGLSQTWDAVPEHQRPRHPSMRHFLSTIDSSTGIERPSEQPPDADLDRAHAKWLERYGAQIADELRQTVDINMCHYEHMKSFVRY